MGSYARVLIGLIVGLGVGLLITLFVIVTKVGFLVDTPRAAHPLVLAALVGVPAIAGALIGAFWRRSSTRS